MLYIASASYHSVVMRNSDRWWNRIRSISSVPPIFHYNYRRCTYDNCYSRRCTIACPWSRYRCSHGTRLHSKWPWNIAHNSCNNASASIKMVPSGNARRWYYCRNSMFGAWLWYCNRCPCMNGTFRWLLLCMKCIHRLAIHCCSLVERRFLLTTTENRSEISN